MRMAGKCQTNDGWLIWQGARMRVLLFPPMTRQIQLWYKQLLVLKTASRLWHSFSCQKNHQASKYDPRLFCQSYTGLEMHLARVLGPRFKKEKKLESISESVSGPGPKVRIPQIGKNLQTALRPWKRKA
jgi:hypothetical protein